MTIKPMLPLLLLLGAVTAQAQVNSLPSQPHLLVKGHAERQVRPDRFVVTIALQRVDLSPEQARSLAQADAAQVLKAFKDHHALEDSIEASSLSIQPKHVYEESKQVFKGTQVRRELNATFGDLAQVRGLLGDIKTSESLQITGLSAQFSGEGRVRAQLKQEAAAQSRQSAQGLAKAYGTRITGLYTISDVAPNFAYGVEAGTWPTESESAEPRAMPAAAPDTGASLGYNAAGAAESLEAGMLTLSENIYAIYLITP